MEENKCQSELQKGQKEGFKELQADQPHFGLSECNVVTNSGNHFQTFEGQEDDLE